MLGLTKTSGLLYSILCFCETWLNAAQPTPLLLDDQIDVRCDRMTNENRGGVLICVPSQFNSSNAHRSANTGIEAVSATIQLPNSENLQIAVVYRSPSVSQAMIATLLTRLLRHVTVCAVPCVILGDFNEDFLHCHNSAIVTLMSTFSFTQIVPYPTTPQATLIDHVYFRNTTSHTISAIVKCVWY